MIESNITEYERNNTCKEESSIHRSSEDEDTKTIDITQIELDNKEGIMLDDEPDGGYGWIVVFGTFCVQVTSFGLVASVINDYLEEHIFPDEGSQFLLSWTATILEIFVNLMGPVVQILISNYGARVVLIIGTLFVTVGLELASLSTEIWHLYLTFGVLFGIGASLLYVTAMGSVTLWFTKKRGLATGLAASGSGIGGLIFPFIITPINNTLGYQWTFRILGFVCLVCDIIACICVKERVSSKQKKGQITFKTIFHLNIFKNMNYNIWVWACVFSLMGYFIPFFYLPAHANHLGLSSDQSTALIAIMSTGNFVGRLVAGYVGDKIGRLNTNLIFTFLCSATSFIIWTVAYTYHVLIVYCILFGIFCGSYFAMFTPLTAFILEPKQFLTGLSTLLLFNIISVFGISIASAVEQSVDAEPYFSYKMFAGVTYFLGAFFLFILRFRLSRKIFYKV